ncbi:MAG TPA: DUF5025 domain-containing protein [Cyclobacteriaceae bacterium]|nr:DUF5025 domain-containing protein [Cyclobacteriaceae bacterium]
MNRLRVIASLIAGLLLMVSCEGDFENADKTERLNDFEMTLNDQVWTPSEIDACTSTFQCQMSKWVSVQGDETYVYHVKAYRDPQAVASLNSENFFQFQIMGANQIGTYTVDGAFKDSDSFARLTVNDANGKRIYQNKLNENLFTVTINKFYQKGGSELIGIKGSFEGTLYNMTDPLDVVHISKGEFDFSKINHFDFNQCSQ